MVPPLANRRCMRKPDREELSWTRPVESSNRTQRTVSNIKWWLFEATESWSGLFTAKLIKVCLVKAVVFPVVMYRCESWTIKRAECQRIDAFELWCWRRLLRVPWTAKRSKQSILQEINPEYSLEGLMMKLKLQYFGQLMRRADSLEKTLMQGKIEGRRRRGQQEEMVGWHHWLDGREFEQALGVGDRQGSLVYCSLWGPKESDTTKQLNWTELKRI